MKAANKTEVKKTPGTLVVEKHRPLMNKLTARFFHERGVARLEVFGSALRDDFGPDSDVDLLCTLTPEKDQRCGLLECVEMQFKLAEIFGRQVDLVSRWPIELSRNPYSRHAILSTARPIYVEG